VSRRFAVPDGWTVCAYRFALAPNAAAEKALYGHCGAARFAYNHLLALTRANIAQRRAEASYGLSGDDLIPALNWSAPGLRKIWNQRKHWAAVNSETGQIWWDAYSKEAYSSACQNLAAALANWHQSHTGQRAGRTMGFPRFKRKKGDALGSVTFTTGAIRLDDRTHVVLPRIGRVKTHESTRKLARRIEAGTARILAATIKREHGRWFVVFRCLIQRQARSPRKPSTAVGVDLGITTLAVTSDGIRHPNPRYMVKALGDLRRQSRKVCRRQGPDKRTGFGGSKRWHRASRRRNRVQHRVADQRRDGLHKLTSHLVATYGAICVEDLNVAGLLRNCKLARAIADCGFGQMRHMLTYKSVWAGTVFALADRWYPSSKTCSSCKAVKTKLALSERTFICGHCGLVLDRDLNAAINLADQITILFPEWPGEVKRGRGARISPPCAVAVGTEASTRRPGCPVQGPSGGNARITDHR